MSYVSLKLTMSKTKLPSRHVSAPRIIIMIMVPLSTLSPARSLGQLLTSHSFSMPLLFVFLSLSPVFSHPVFFLLLLSQAPLSAASLTHPIGPPRLPSLPSLHPESRSFLRTSSCFLSFWDHSIQQVGAPL